MCGAAAGDQPLGLVVGDPAHALLVVALGPGDHRLAAPLLAGGVVQDGGDRACRPCGSGWRPSARAELSGRLLDLGLADVGQSLRGPKCFEDRVEVLAFAAAAM
jgi:hypothetical protein